MKFEKIDVTKANVNPFQRIGQDWMLISAKKEGKVNTMTASWGMMGVFWGKNVVTVVHSVLQRNLWMQEIPLH